MEDRREWLVGWLGGEQTWMSQGLITAGRRELMSSVHTRLTSN